MCRVRGFRMSGGGRSLYGLIHSGLILCVLGQQTLVDQRGPEVVKKPVFGKDVMVTCGIEEMTTTISKKYLQDNSGWLMIRNQLCLTDRTCCATSVNGSLSIKITGDFSSCGNEISVIEVINSTGSPPVTHYKFSNKLVYGGRLGAISRDIPLLHFDCLYSADLFVTARPPESAVSAHVIKIKKIGGQIALFTNEEFNEKYHTPLEMPENEQMFIKVRIEDLSFSSIKENRLEIVSVIRKCLINDANIEHQIISNGCPKTNKTKIFSNAKSLESTIGVDTRSFVSPDSTNATIRCVVDLCIKTSRDACEPICTRRKKRFSNGANDRQSKYFLKFKGKELSATIILKNSTMPQISTTQQTFVNDEPDKSLAASNEKLNSKFLPMFIIGGVGFILISGIAASILIYRRIWLRHK